MSTPDFAKGASGPANPYDTSPSGLGLTPAYLAPGATASASAMLGASTIQHNGSDVASESTVDFENGTGITWTVIDDSGNARVKVTPGLVRRTESGTVSNSATSFTVSFGTAFSSAPVVVISVARSPSTTTMFVSAVSTTGFTVTNSGADGTLISWIAEGPL